jgi:hypothetical protein
LYSRRTPFFDSQLRAAPFVTHATDPTHDPDREAEQLVQTDSGLRTAALRVAAFHKRRRSARRETTFGTRSAAPTLKRMQTAKKRGACIDRVWNSDAISMPRSSCCAVRWYLQYKLSYRDLAEIMAERGISVAPSTILRWVQHYAPEFEKRWNRFARPVGGSWRVDETYVKIRGRWTYLFFHLAFRFAICADVQCY